VARDLTQRVAQRTEGGAAGTAVATQDQPQPTIYQLIEQQKSEIARALPKHMDADRLARVVVTCLRQNQGLLNCTPQSLLGALMLSAQTGLEPGPLGHAYLVPFGREVTWILGYKGIVELFRRSGKGKSIAAREVYANDFFEYEYGLNERLVHRPYMGDGQRGEIIAFYGVAHFLDGGHHMHVMTKAEVDAHRERSRAKNSGPWVNDYVAMGRKTVIRVMAPFLPLSIEAAAAIASDEKVRTDWQAGQDMLSIEPPPQREPDADPVTGEVLEGTVASDAMTAPDAPVDETGGASPDDPEWPTTATIPS
jgi:recombination protein RecT